MQLKNLLKTLMIAIAFLSLSFATQAQRTIQGVVTDEAGNALPGVTVLNVDKTNGVVTNIEGKYTILVEPGSTLQFSFVGMTTQQIRVEDQTIIDVTLVEDAVGLEEVVVVGYGQSKKVTFTGAVSTVTSEDLIKSPVSSISNSLAGKLSGISAVQNTGQPGNDEANLYIRGIATLNDATPLTIVDGVERPFSQIDVEEIESVSILKDASATAVYGVRGANGVIIVTTKRGEQGKAKISVSTSMGLQQPTMMLDKSDSYIYALGHNERNLNDGNDPSTNVFSDEVIDIFKDGGNLLYPSMDWYDYLFRDFAPQSKTNLTISGGTDKVRYFTSLGYTSQAGQLNDFDPRYDENFRYDRYNYRSNLDIDITESTLLKITIGGATEVVNSPQTRQSGIWKEANWGQPMAGAGIVDGKWLTTSQDNITLEFKDPMNSFYGGGYTSAAENTLNFDLDLIQKLDMITPGLRAKVKGSYNTDYTHAKVRTSSADHYEAIYMPGDSSQIVYKKTGDANKLSYSEWNNKARNWYMEAALDYSRQFGNHDVGGLLLYNQRVVYYPGGTYNDIPRRTLGLVGRITYNYKMKYLFDFNMGYNGSENFPEDKRYGFFPAVSVGWILSEESFMQNASFIDYLKIRGSYGLVGNDLLGDNRFLYLPDAWDYSVGGYNFGVDNPNDQPGANEIRIGNPNLTWETAVKQNYGFDAKFLKGRLSVSFDYFNEDRKDILIIRNTVPNFVAANLPAVNLGEVKNHGFEIEFKWNQKLSKDLSYMINANMSYAKNEIVYKDEIPQPYDYLYETGKPVGQQFGYVFDGFFQDTINTTTDPDYADQLGILYPGDIIWKDVNNDGKIDDLDKKPIGYSTKVPEYNYGINLLIRYKAFDLSLTFSGVKNTSRNLPAYFREPYGGQNRGLFTYLYDGRWTPETAETAEWSRFSLNSGENNYKDSDLYIRDASYFRLKNAELGYTIKFPALKQMGLSNIRVYINGYNLITWTDFYFFDPESAPGSGGLYPMIKVYNMGLKFNF
jgi:TonB-linked SusC/RagA family outer membrane protein